MPWLHWTPRCIFHSRGSTYCCADFLCFESLDVVNAHAGRGPVVPCCYSCAAGILEAHLEIEEADAIFDAWNSLLNTSNKALRGACPLCTDVYGGPYEAPTYDEAWDDRAMVTAFEELPTSGSEPGSRLVDTISSVLLNCDVFAIKIMSLLPQHATVEPGHSTCDSSLEVCTTTVENGEDAVVFEGHFVLNSSILFSPSNLQSIVSPQIEKLTVQHSPSW